MVRATHPKVKIDIVTWFRHVKQPVFPIKRRKNFGKFWGLIFEYSIFAWGVEIRDFGGQKRISNPLFLHQT